MTRSDVFVLGAGMIGISVATHLQKRGRAVTLVDRRGAAEETSFGNAGLIQREGIFPYGFPHDFGALLRYGLNRTVDAHYHPSALLRIAPFLWKYWHHSRPARHAADRSSPGRLQPRPHRRRQARDCRRTPSPVRAAGHIRPAKSAGTPPRAA